MSRAFASPARCQGLCLSAKSKMKKCGVRRRDSASHSAGPALKRLRTTVLDTQAPGPLRFREGYRKGIALRKADTGKKSSARPPCGKEANGRVPAALPVYMGR